MSAIRGAKAMLMRAKEKAGRVIIESMDDPSPNVRLKSALAGDRGHVSSGGH